MSKAKGHADSSAWTRRRPTAARRSVVLLAGRAFRCSHARRARQGPHRRTCSPSVASGRPVPCCNGQYGLRHGAVEKNLPLEHTNPLATRS